MALTSITKDFITRAGVIVQGTAAVSSSTGQLGALQVNSGAAIAKNLIVGSTASLYSTLYVADDLTVNNNSFFVDAQTGNIFAAGQAGIQGTLNSTGTFTVNTDKFIVSSGTGNVYAEGNAGIKGTLNSTGTLSVNTDKFIVDAASGNTYIEGNLGVNGNTVNTGTVDILDATAATTAGGGDGALRVTGGVYIGDNLIVNSLAFDTGTNTSNALYVKGGAWIDKTLVVGGQVTFQNSVYFNGTATYVLSTNTVYTDNLLQLHIPPGGDINNHVWTQDDGKDIGLIYHYYKGSDQDAFLGFANDSGYLEWYDQGSESNTGTYVGTRYGIFKTGGIYLVNPTTSTNTTTGALVVEGGVGIGGDVNIGGNLSVKSIRVSGGGDVAVYVSTATNLQYGLAGQIPIQYAEGKTAFISTGTPGTVLTWSTNSNTATWVSPDVTVVGAASNIVGGQATWIPFQDAPNKTVFDGGGDFAYNSATTVQIIGDIEIHGADGYDTDTMIQAKGGKDIELASDTKVQLNYTNTNYLYLDATGANIVAPTTYLAFGSGSGQLEFKGSFDNKIVYPQVGTGAPTNNSYSAGTKIVLWDNVGASSTGYAIGLDTNTMWFGLDLYANSHSFKWYGNTIPIMTLTNELLDVAGALQINTTTPTFTTSTLGAVRVLGGVGIAKDIYVHSTATFDGSVRLRNTDSDYTTSSNNALYVAGGVGIAKDLYVHSTATIDADLYVGGTIYMKGVGLDNITGSTGTFDYVFIEGTGTGLTVFDNAWIKGNTVQLGATGANQLASLTTSTLEVRGGWGNPAGGLSLFAGNYPTNYSKIFLSGDKTIFSEANTFTFKSFAGVPLVTVSATTASTSSLTGAVVVNGGVGIEDDLWVGDELHVAGVVEFTNTTQARGTGTDTGAVKITGGLLVKKNIVAGGLVIGGDYMGGAVPTNPANQTVEAFKGSNNMQAGFTTGVIIGSSETNLDVFDATKYTTAKYIVQVVDGSNVHSSEILLIHNGTNSYLTEYGIITSNGELGTFGADLSGGNVTLKFVPTSATAMRINVIRTSILTSISAYAV